MKCGKKEGSAEGKKELWKCVGSAEGRKCRMKRKRKEGRKEGVPTLKLTHIN